MVVASFGGRGWIDAWTDKRLVVPISRTSAGMLFGIIAVTHEQFGNAWPKDFKLIGKEWEACENHCALPSLTDLGATHNANSMSAIPIFTGSHWMAICIQSEDG